MNNCQSMAVRPLLTPEHIPGMYVSLRIQGRKSRAGRRPKFFVVPAILRLEPRRSYAIPWWGMNGPDGTATFVFGTLGTGQFVGVKLADIPQPATTIMLVEFPSSTPDITLSTDPLYVNNSFGNYSNSYVTGPGGTGAVNTQDKSRPGRPIHLDGWNYLFSDGHVKWMRPEQTRVGVTTNLAQRVPGNLWARIKE